jgi:energy-coupling factor transport system ATP-binding protein
MSAEAALASLLKVAAVDLRYPGESVAALDGIDLALGAGEIGILLGAEGSGRSSLLQVIAGLEPANSGASFAGEVRLHAGGMERRLPGAGLAAWSDDVAIVLDDPAAQRSGARRTVREEVAFGLECRGVPTGPMAQRVDEALATMGLTPLAARDPDTLSGGQTTRLALASAWVQGPRLLLLDEADAALDAAGRARLRWLLSALSRQGGAALWAPARCEATDEGEVEELRTPVGRSPFAARLAWLLAAGRVVAQGPIADLWPGMTLEEHGVEPPLRARAEAVIAAGGHRVGVAPSGAGARIGAAHRAIDPDDLRVDDVCTLAAESLSVTYAGGILGLREVSVAAQPGEILALVGPNGSGKTTLLRALLGLAPVIEGWVHFNGRDVTAARSAERARWVGLAFQRPTDQLFASSVTRDVVYGPRNLGFGAARREAAVAAALRVCGLEGAADLHPLDLGRSGRRRAALAGVLAMETPIVALDEPDHGLDARGKQWLRELMQGLRTAGRTVLLVSHDLDLVGAVADRVAVLVGGELRALGMADALLRDETLLHAAGLSVAPAVKLGRGYGFDPPPLHGEALLAAIAETRS